MANPGPFPPMGGPMQPMGGPPMLPMGPMGPMGMRQPIRQGTSKVIPVVVSAGLAVGVFCGLLFGLGTGKHVNAEPSKASNGVKRTDDSPPDVPTLSTDTVKPLAPPPKAASSPGLAAGSAVAATGSGAATGSAAPTIKSVKLTIEIKPDTAVPVAKILVDGKPITGTSVDIALDPDATQKKVHLQVQAPGFRDGARDLDVFAKDSETSVSFELEPKGGRAGGSSGEGTPSGGAPSSGSPGAGSPSGDGNKSGGGSKSGGGRGGKTGKGKSGLIDI